MNPPTLDQTLGSAPTPPAGPAVETVSSLGTVPRRGPTPDPNRACSIGAEIAGPLLNRASSIALSLAAAQSLVTGPAAERLHHARDELDSLIRDIRNAVVPAPGLSAPEESGVPRAARRAM